jgi:hypothetical protein
MPVPEATMHKNDGTAPLKDYIRLAGKIFAMQPIAITPLMQPRSDQQFGFCVLASDACHHAAAGFTIDHIHHHHTPAISFWA